MNGKLVNLDWNGFWQKAGDFFMVPDSSGLNYLTRIIIAVCVIFVAYFVIKLLGFLFRKAFKVKKRGPDIDISAKNILVQIIKAILWIATAFVVASILKFDLTGLAGITSAIAVALGLALQDLIGCLFSGILLLQQKMIKTGDYISVNNTYGASEGFVENVHLFFTYLRTPQGQIITIPNNSMTKATITNYSRLGKRRIDYDVGISYNTDITFAKNVFNKIFDGDERILQEEGITIIVNKLDSYSVQMRLRCWTSYDDYWPVYNELGEKILIACKENGINIPTSIDRNIIESKDH